MKSSNLINGNNKNSSEVFGKIVKSTSVNNFPVIKAVKMCNCLVSSVCPMHGVVANEKKKVSVINSSTDSCKSNSSWSSKSNNHNNKLGGFKSDSDFSCNANERPEAGEKLSLASLLSKQAELALAVKKKRSELAFRQWLYEKNEMKRKLEMEKAALKQKIEQEKEMRLQRDRENFINWLKGKKRQEREKLKMEQQIQEEKRRKEWERLRLEEFKEIEFQEWCNKKNQQELAKKAQEREQKLKEENEKQLRLKLSATSFQAWLQRNKSATGRRGSGINATTSTTFVNPTPWVPNIDTQNNFYN